VRDGWDVVLLVPVAVHPAFRSGEGIMETRQVHASFTDFSLPSSTERREATVAIPVSDGIQQRYFFMNLKTGKAVTVKYPRRAGLTTLDAFAYLHHLCSFTARKDDKWLPKMRTMFRRYHNGISFIELLYKVLKPHGMTYIGDQRFLVSLWSASIYFVIDLKKRTIECQMLSKERDEVFSTYQHFDETEKETYFATQQGEDELHKHVAEDTDFDVPIVIKRYNWVTGETAEIWKGGFDTDTHYIALNKDKSYLGLVNFGDFFDKEGQLLPSKILILDMKNKKEWRIDNNGWSPSAHIDWDPWTTISAIYRVTRASFLPLTVASSSTGRRSTNGGSSGQLLYTNTGSLQTGPRSLGYSPIPRYSD